MRRGVLAGVLIAAAALAAQGSGIGAWLHPAAPWLGSGFVAVTLAAFLLAAAAERQRRRTLEELSRHEETDERLRRSESEARAAEFQKRLLLETTEEGIYALDPEGRCLWANPAAARLFRLSSPADMVGRDMHALIHHTRADGSPFPASECKGLANLQSRDVVVQPQELLWRADGTSFYAEVRVNPILHEGRMLGGVVTLRDITERLRLEEQVREAQKLEAVGQLASGVAHDFNNLLAVIQGYTELMLQRADLDPAASRRLQAVAHAGGRASEIVQQLLAFSRRGAFHPELLALNDTLHGVETTVRDVLGSEMTLELDLAPDLACIQADEEELEHVLMNLVVNARDAMADGGRLQIRTANVLLDSDSASPLGLRAGPHVMLAVSDTGAGMDAEVQRQMFEPFFTTKPPSRGAGLGLAVARNVIRQSQGAIAVESALERGTTVRIYLPAQVDQLRPTPAGVHA